MHPDPRVVRQRANRTASRFAQHAAVHREIGARLLQHLDPVRIAPRRVLELGCATGGFTDPLERRYANADIIAMDFAQARVALAAARRRRFRNRRRVLCADARAVPLPDNSVDLVCANLLMHWLVDPGPVLAECARVLRHGGLLAFSALGPDSLQELHPLLPEARTCIHPLPDMHHLADAVVGAGFSDVVADMEVLRAPYYGPADLVTELRATGSTYCGLDRRRGLSAEPWLRQLLSARDARASLEVRFEVVYLHGWYFDRRSVAVKLPGA